MVTIKVNGYGLAVSPHEITGIIAEEWKERIMEKERDKLRFLYLEDLRREVSYGGKVKPRARRVDTVWARQHSTVGEVPIDINQYENVWVWSDIHFGHSNIIKYCDRPFCDANIMNQRLIANHNYVVGKDDLVIWVGDVSFMNTHQTNSILSHLTGDRILIIGNHDFDRKGRIKDMNFNEIHLIYTLDGEVPLLFTHYPMSNTPMPWINVHGHVHNSPHDEDNSLQHINVSVEVLDYKPIHLDELKRIAKTRLTSMENK